jgi:3-phytase
MRRWLLVIALAGLVGAVLPAGAAGAPDPDLVAVPSTLETPPLFDDEAGGGADGDDPAIWVHPTRPGRSLVVVTKKDAGLSVSDLAGRELQAIAPPPAPGPDDAAGRFNNVDLVYGFRLGGRRVDLAVVTDRGSDRLRAFAIDPGAAAAGDPPLHDVTASDAPLVFSADQAEVNQQTTAYGLAAWHDRRAGAAWAFVSQRHRRVVAKARLVADGGRVTYRVVASLTLPGSFRLPDGTSWEPCGEPGEQPQVEGMVVDTRAKVLYAAQEDVGVWRMGVDLGRTRPTLVDRVRELSVPASFDEAEEECVVDWSADPGFGGRHLSADAEGLTIYYGRGRRGYLLASSQGDSTFAVYQRTGANRFLGGYRIVDTGAVDGVQDSDGAAVVNLPLGRCFPAGLLVVHDGENTPEVAGPDGEPRANTNFKYVAWPDLAAAFDPPLLVDPSVGDPRR